MAMTAMQEFLAGKSVVYSGLDGRLYIAKFLNQDRPENRDAGVPTLIVKRPNGQTVHDLVMGEHNARNFFWNLDAEAE